MHRSVSGKDQQRIHGSVLFGVMTELVNFDLGYVCLNERVRICIGHRFHVNVNQHDSNGSLGCLYIDL